MTFRWLGVPVVLTLLVLLLAASSNAASPSLTSAVKHYAADEFGKAEEILVAGLKKSPDDMAARLLLGWSQWGQGRYDEALVVFKTVLREAPAQRIPTYEEYDAFNIPREIAYIDNPDLLQARKGLAWTYLKKGWVRAALEQFHMIREKAPTWDEPYLGRGYARLALGDLAGAKEDFAEHVKLASNKRNGERALGDLAAAERKFDVAARHYERALKAKPKWPEVQVELAWTYVRLSRLADAQKVFEGLAATQPLEREAGFAHLALAAKRYDDTEAWLGRVFRIAPQHARAVEIAARLRHERYGELDRAWALYNAGQLTEAAARFDKLVKDPGALPAQSRVSILNGLGWTRLALKQTDLAEQAFKESLKAGAGGAEATAGLGWVALNRKEWSKAEKSLTEAATAAPGLAAAQRGYSTLRQARFAAYDQARALHSAGKPAEALAAFTRIEAAPGELPADARPLVTAGAAWAKLDLNQLEAAERAFADIAKTTGSARAEGEAGLGWIALKRQQPDQAHTRFAAALTAVPGHQAALRGVAELRKLAVPDLDAAWIAYRAGKFVEAAQAFRRVADTSGAPAEYRTEAVRGLGWALLRSGKPADALRSFDVLGATVTDADALFGRGLALAAAGRPADGMEALKRAAALAPASADLQLALGRAALKTGDAKAAERSFETAYRLAPASAEINRALGLARAQQNRPAEALSFLRYAVAEAPATSDGELRTLIESRDYAPLKRDLAWGYVRWHGFEQARPFFEELVQQDKNDGDALFGLGYVLYKVGKHKDADKVLERAARAKRPPIPRTAWVSFTGLGAYPILTDATSIRGWSALAAGDVDRAREHFTQSLERDPDSVSSMSGLAVTLQRAGQRSAARDIYVLASEIYPSYPVVMAGLRETEPLARHEANAPARKER